jgi:hypothetical protein
MSSVIPRDPEQTFERPGVFGSAKSPDGNFYAADATIVANSSCYRHSMLAWSLSVVQRTCLITTSCLPALYVLSSLGAGSQTSPNNTAHPRDLSYGVGAVPPACSSTAKQRRRGAGLDVPTPPLKLS